MRISQLTSLAKTAVLSTDYLLTANTTTSINQKIQVQDLFPTISNSTATANTSLIGAVTDKNEYSISRLVAGSAKMSITGGGGSSDVSIDLGTVNFSDLGGTVTNTQLAGSIDLTTKVTGALPIANGGTASTSTTYCNLTSNVTGTLPTSKGGTGIDSSSAAFTQYSLFYATTTTAMGQLAAATNGQLLMGSTSASPAWGNITSADGSIAISSGAASIGLTVTSIPNLGSNIGWSSGSAREVSPATVTSGTGDALTVKAGSTSSGEGGKVTLQGGVSTGSNRGGAVEIKSGGGSTTPGTIKMITTDGIGAATTEVTAFQLGEDNRIMINNNTGGVPNADAAVHIYNKAATNIANLKLEQADSNEPFIDFEGTTGTSGAANIDTEPDGDTSASTVAAPHSAVWTLKGMYRVNINGTDYWAPYYHR